jgi:hypothetical protein
MSLSLLTLQGIFPEIFPNADVAFTADTIRKMIAVDDICNQDAYKFSDSLNGNTFEKNSQGAFVLYAHSTGVGGIDRWKEIDGAAAKIPDSKEIYLKIVDGNNKGSYISIYDLVTLDASKISNKNSLTYGNIGSKVAAVTYALSCMKMKQVLLQIGNLNSLNLELEIINKIMGELAQMKDRLSQTDVKNRATELYYYATESPSEAILRFFGERHLLDKSQLLGKDNSISDTYYNYYLGENYSSARWGIDLTGNHVQFWMDTARIYYEQISNQQSKLSNEMEAQMKMAQQDVSIATNFLKSIGKMFFGITGNVR